MDDRVKAEYDKILTAAIINHGVLVRHDQSVFAWMDDELNGEYSGGRPRHSLTCGIGVVGKAVENATWYEFAGTFAEDGDAYKHGMEVHGVSCKCGKIKDRVFRWDAPVGEAIRIVMMSLLEERVNGDK